MPCDFSHWASQQWRVKKDTSRIFLKLSLLIDTAIRVVQPVHTWVDCCFEFLLYDRGEFPKLVKWAYNHDIVYDFLRHQDQLNVAIHLHHIVYPGQKVLPFSSNGCESVLLCFQAF